MRTRPGRVEPEVYFRIVRVAGDGHHGVSSATYREQTVEIALGHKEAFENSSATSTTRTLHLGEAGASRAGRGPHLVGTAMFGSDAGGDDLVTIRLLELLFEEGAEAQSRQLVQDDVLHLRGQRHPQPAACAPHFGAGTRTGISG